MMLLHLQRNGEVSFSSFLPTPPAAEETAAFSVPCGRFLGFIVQRRENSLGDKRLDEASEQSCFLQRPQDFMSRVGNFYVLGLWVCTNDGMFDELAIN